MNNVIFKNKLLPALPGNIPAIIIFLMCAFLVQVASAQEELENIPTLSALYRSPSAIPTQEGFEKITTLGQAIPGVRGNTVKANQSQVIWHGGYWWGIFRDTPSPGEWSVYQFKNDTWTKKGGTGITSGEGADTHIDESEGKLYVIVSTTRRFSRLSYNSGTESWLLDSGIPTEPVFEQPTGGSDNAASITRAADGDLFISYFLSGSGLRVAHSTDGGVNWTIYTVNSGVASSLTDCISFRQGGNNYIGIFVGEQADSYNFRFFRLRDDLAPTSNNWEEDTGVPFSGDSDNHASMVKDGNNNLYMVGKDGDDVFQLFKRSNSGAWSHNSIYGFNTPTRPTLAVDDDNNSLIVLATVDDKIQFVVLDKNNLRDVFEDEWFPVLENSNDVFAEVTVSYQILNNSSNLMVCAQNNSASPREVWFNVLDLDDIALPVFLASFQANPGFDRINLEWVTHSEVDNWEWIVFRQEEGELQFQELTRLPGSGTTSSSSYYAYSDTDVLQGVVYSYRLANVDYNGQVNYYPEIVKASLTPLSGVETPVATLQLYPNYPNPFNAETTVSFEIMGREYTRVYIYDMMGRLVTRLFEGYLSSGSYNYKWDGKDRYGDDVASGVYLLDVSAGQFRDSGKMILSR